MLGAFEHNAARKGLVQIQHNWEHISRDDIYRQRVLGTDSGMKDFIKVDDTRKLTKIELLVYLVFLLFTVFFFSTRYKPSTAYKVNSAVTSALYSKAYSVNPVRKTIHDVRDVDDVEQWLLNALPDFLTPAVQNFNVPIGPIRITFRRVLQVENNAKRFTEYAPLTWVTTNRVRNIDNFDDKQSFGAARKWMPFSLDNKQTMKLDWKPETKGFACDGGTLLDALDNRGPRGQIIQDCKNWCEQLIDPYPCRCFTLTSNSKCLFYYMPLENRDASVVESKFPGLQGPDLAGEVLPDMTPQAGSSAFAPVITKFAYNTEESGYQKTPGYVEIISYATQEQINAATGDGEAPWTQVAMLANQMKDYIGGGMLRNGTTWMVIDFVTFNSNYGVFTWTVIKFFMEPSGSISYGIQARSIEILREEVMDDSAGMFDRFTVTDWFYSIAVLVYVILEIWDMLQEGPKYLKSLWNWLSLVSWSLQCAAIISYGMYLQAKDFTKDLQNLQNEDGGAIDLKMLVHLDAQMFAFSRFVQIESYNMCFACFLLVRFMHDTRPRVKVLVDTMTRSFTPIIFLLAIIAAAWAGFSFWANIMFGTEIEAFSTFFDSTSSCMQILFGNDEVFPALQEKFPYAGVFFFIIYMMIFFLVLQKLSAAVVLASYDDASQAYADRKRKEDDRRAAAESDTSGSPFALISRSAFVKRAKTILISASDEAEKEISRQSTSGSLANKKYSRSAMMCYATYVIMYLVMASLITQVELANRMVKTIDLAINTPTYTTTLPVSNELVKENFSTIESHSDVAEYLYQALPQTLFNSSRGTFDGRTNPYKTYYSALLSGEVYNQLVVDNWNIIVGQKPVRISLRYFKMEDAGEENYISGVLAKSVKIRPPNDLVEIDHAGNPTGNFIEAVEFADIVEPSTREVLEKYCNYTFAYGASKYTESTGFMCMLDVDYGKTMAILKDMHSNRIISNQTAVVVVDFVMFNGFAEVFAYVSVVIGFQPSGLVTKNVHAFTVRLELYHSLLSYSQLVLEIAVFVITVAYLVQYILALCLAIRHRPDKNQAKNCLQRTFSIISAIAYLYAGNLFNMLDIVSSLMTIVTMIFWYVFVFNRFRQEYYFQEFPVWNQGVCDALDWAWCSDEAVIHEFSFVVDSLRLFVQILSVNTVLIFLRLLKYLQAIPKVNVIFIAFYRGMMDIVWFIIVMFVILLGYVLFVYAMFGSNVKGLSSPIDSIAVCFEMFLGHFDYEALKAVDPVAAPIFFFSYMILFKYLIINMFVAIVDRNYREEHQERQNAEELLKEQGLMPSGGTLANALKSLKQIFGRTIRGVHGGAADLALESAANFGKDVIDQIGDNIADAEEVATYAVQAVTGTAEEVDATQDEEAEDAEVVDITEGSVKMRNWHHLPQDLKTWAVETASTIDKFVWERKKERERKGLNKNVESSELDRILQEAEMKIKEKRKRAHTVATEVKQNLEKDQLTNLKQIHDDQESLAWYIMKREAELKKLEATKELKQERLNKMTEAAESLIDKPNGENDNGRGEGSPPPRGGELQGLGNGS